MSIIIKECCSITIEYITTSLQIQKQMNSGVNFEDGDVDLKLFVSKPIHVILLVKC